MFHLRYFCAVALFASSVSFCMERSTSKPQGEVVDVAVEKLPWVTISSWEDGRQFAQCFVAYKASSTYFVSDDTYALNSGSPVRYGYIHGALPRKPVDYPGWILMPLVKYSDQIPKGRDLIAPQIKESGLWMRYAARSEVELIRSMIDAKKAHVDLIKEFSDLYFQNYLSKYVKIMNYLAQFIKIMPELAEKP